jgi:mRNA-degrading endonuclease YafQ of YafQ-DinJ toxin-antitoxin module
MYEIEYSPRSIKEFKKFDENLQDEVHRALELLKDKDNWEQLRVHKLQGRLKGKLSASVNFSYRIIFGLNKDVIGVQNIGDHSIYN